jgi:Glycopeptide antibiotics resistance protein
VNADVFVRLAGLGLFVGPVAVALSLTAYFIRRRAPGTVQNTAAFVCFSIYVGIAGTVTLAPPPLSVGNGHFGSNLVPLVYSFRCFIPNPGQPSTTRFCLETIVGNVALFVPLGALLPLMLRRDMPARTVFIVALVASISVETLQFVGRWVGNARWSDIDDVIFNVAGALVGYVIFQAVVRHVRRRSPAPRPDGFPES